MKLKVDKQHAISLFFSNFFLIYLFLDGLDNIHDESNKKMKKQIEYVKNILQKVVIHHLSSRNFGMFFDGEAIHFGAKVSLIRLRFNRNTDSWFRHR
jgi:hypothetical protein